MKKNDDSDNIQIPQLVMNGFEHRTDENPTVPDVNTKPKLSEPTLEQWSRLYEVAGTLNQIAPWNFLWDSDLVTIMLPGREEPVYCSVMGRIGECYAIGVYPGYEAIRGYYRLAKSSDDSPTFIAGFEQNCLICYYGDREEITPKDRKVLKALNLKFRGRNEWIYFRSMESGYYPWYIDSEQADLMIDTLQNLAMACKYLVTNELKVDFEGGETLLRFYSPEKELWLNTAVKMPPIPVDEERLLIEDELLVARLKKQKRNNWELELDLFYLPMPIQPHKEDRPHLPRFIMLADRTNCIPLDQHMGEQDADIEDAVIEIVAEYIKKYGRPSAIYVRDEQTGRYIEDLCQKLGIKLIQGRGMPAIDTLVEEMLDFIQ